MSWLEEAAKEGHEPELQPQEIPCVKETTCNTADAVVTDRHEHDAR